MSRKKRDNKKIRIRYEVSGSQLIKEGKLSPYHHLKDWIDILEERKVNRTNWWERMTP